MRRKSRFTPNQKEQAVLRYINGYESQREISASLEIDNTSFRRWLAIYEARGIEGFIPSPHNNSYSK